MIISRESDYAIRILRAIADGEKYKIKDLCESEYIPLQFSYKIIEKLRAANLVRCELGRYGGVVLNCNLHEVSLFELLQVVDNDCYLNLCLTPGYECPWEKNHPDSCKVHRNLLGLQGQLDDTLKNMSLYSVIFELK